MLALMQCAERGITPGPIATFMGWKDKGRYVRKGQRAIVLCMPITSKRKATYDQPSSDSSDEITSQTFTRFVYRPNWFVLAQTEGQDVEPTPIPDWDQARALETLGIVEEPFTATDGNCQGYATTSHTTKATTMVNVIGTGIPNMSRIHCAMISGSRAIKHKTVRTTCWGLDLLAIASRVGQLRIIRCAM
jgi:hypothetical protein